MASAGNEDRKQDIFVSSCERFEDCVSMNASDKYFRVKFIAK